MSDVIEFSVVAPAGGPALKFESIDSPAERLAIYPWEDGELGERICTVIPPGGVEWSNEALERWASQEFLPALASASII